MVSTASRATAVGARRPPAADGSAGESGWLADVANDGAVVAHSLPNHAIIHVWCKVTAGSMPPCIPPLLVHSIDKVVER